MIGAQEKYFRRLDEMESIHREMVLAVRRSKRNKAQRLKLRAKRRIQP